MNRHEIRLAATEALNNALQEIPKTKRSLLVRAFQENFDDELDDGAEYGEWIDYERQPSERLVTFCKEQDVDIHYVPNEITKGFHIRVSKRED